MKSNDLKLQSENYKVFKDEAGVKMTFNVMPGRSVSETFDISEYRLFNRDGKYSVEADFSREYLSEMKNSPTHVIFLTMLVHLQKMTYIMMCDYFDLPIDTKGEEVIKIWPVNLNVKMPVMIEKETNLRQVLELDRVRKSGPGKYLISGKTSITGKHGTVTSTGSTIIYNLKEM